MNDVSRQRADIGVTVFIIALLSWVLWEAQDWEIRARLFPMTIGIPLLVLATGHLVLSLRRAAAVSAEPRNVPGPADNGGDTMSARLLLRIVGWILLFTLAMWLLGFPVGGALATLAFLRFDAGERWVAAVIYAASVWICLALIFDRLLEVTFPQPVLIGVLGA